jgi:hypothetical protein
MGLLMIVFDLTFISAKVPQQKVEKTLPLQHH